MKIAGEWSGGEYFIDPNGEKLHGPKGTRADLEFLESCGIDPWSSFWMIVYVVSECPWRDDKEPEQQCDRDRHQWDGEEVMSLDTAIACRTCSKCGEVDYPDEEGVL